ncbi:MAG: M13-type metalloendopeptidase [Acidobacteriota bacterium]
MKRVQWIVAVVLALSPVLVLAAEETGTSATKTLESGIDFDGFDKSIRPQDDFNGYVNGGWIAKTEIPADKPYYGSFTRLRDLSDERTRTIIEELGREPNLPEGSEERKIGDLYASLMDEGLVDQLGSKPLREALHKVDGIATKKELAGRLAELEKVGVYGPFALFVSIDSGDSTRYAVYLTQAGLGLPNRDYYLKEGEKFDKIRAEYPKYIARLLQLSGFDRADERAQKIYELEHQIAEAQWAPEDNRDVSKTNNRIAVSQLSSVSDRIDWMEFLTSAGAARQDSIFVRQPSYLEKLGTILSETDLETWKDYLRFHIADEASPWLSKDFVAANFDFNGRLINGLQEQRPRWQRAVQIVNGALGEAVGKVYVKRFFPPEAKARMVELVENLLKAYKVSIQNLDWMSPETKAKAEEKRAKFTYKIGYPDEWRDYSGLEIRRDDPIGNLERATQFEYQRDIRKLGEPVDRKEWFMTPQTVNAYHNPRLNEIVFPAAILQPPFFNLEADDAVNYGAIGAVIGHEMGHAFDDQGRKTDGNGNLRDWWTDADATAFQAKAERLVDQYSQFSPVEGLNVNGQLTLGENIGDLTGVTIAYQAYHMSLDGKPAPVIDGFTGDQRFFIGFAQIWRSKGRDEFLRRQVLTDPHSPAQFRAIGPLRNFPPFYAAFHLQEGDGMYLAPDKRVKIW